MTKLTLEQREQLADMYDSGEWDAVMALCGLCIEHHESRLLCTDVSKADRDLVLNKARLEGATSVQRFLNNIQEHIASVKKL